MEETIYGSEIQDIPTNEVNDIAVDIPETKPVGRPTIFGEEMLKRAEEYLLSCEDEEVEKGTDDRPIYSIKVKLPTKGGLARYLGVSRDTLYEWAKEHKEFSDIMEDLGAEQEDKLINNGLSGDYNPTIAKVLLTKHGYTDKTDITSGDKPILGNTIVFRDFSDPNATGS